MSTDTPRWTEDDTLDLRERLRKLGAKAEFLVTDHARQAERIAELEAGQPTDPPAPEPTITLDLADGAVISEPTTVTATVTDAPEGAMVWWFMGRHQAHFDMDQPNNASVILNPEAEIPGERQITAYLAMRDALGPASPIATAAVTFTVEAATAPAIPAVIRTQRDLWGEDSIWTRPLAPDAPIHPDSQAMVAELVRQGEAYGRNINATKWTTALNVADAGTRRFTLVPTKDNGDWYKAVRPIAWPEGARIDPERDRHYTVVETDTGLVKGVWHAEVSKNYMAVHGEYGGVTPMRGADGITPANGETASNLPAIGGTILRDEWARALAEDGYLDHALAMAVPQQWPGHVWPAKRTDGNPSVPSGVPEAAQIPMGTHFRLPSNWVTTREMSREASHLCWALRDHGAYVRDKAGDVVFYAELADEPLMPWAKLQSVLAEIPWGELQVVDHGPRTRRAGL